MSGKKLTKYQMLEQRMTKMECTFTSIGVLAGRFVEDLQTVISADPEVDAWFDEQE